MDDTQQECYDVKAKLTAANGSISSYNTTGESSEHIDVIHLQKEDRQNDRPEVTCGIVGCRPYVLQSCANIKAFTVNISIVYIVHLAFFSYWTGMVRTVERRFDLKSTQTGILFSMNDILQSITIVFIGYIVPKVHIPRFLSLASLLSTVGMFLCATPYFLYGPKFSTNPTDASFGQYYDKTQNTSSLHLSSIFKNGVHSQICHNESMLSFERNVICKRSSTFEDIDVIGNRVMNILLVAGIFTGVGHSGIQSLTLTYIAENVSPEDVSIYIGLFSSLLPWGPVIGLGIASAMTVIPEGFHDTGLARDDPSFIGCWWLGFLIFAILLFISGLPLFYFPKHLTYYYWNKDNNRESNGDIETQLDIIEKKQNSTILGHIKGFVVIIKDLMSNRVYMCLILMAVFAMNIIPGLISNTPRYFEVHFYQPAYKANIIAGTTSAVPGIVGSLVAGYIIKYFRLGLKGSAKLLLTCVLLAVILIGSLMAYSCPVLDMFGHMDTSKGILNMTETCNSECDCVPKHFMPMCDTEGTTYFSPCHAGCKTYSNGTYSDCSCLKDGAQMSHESCLPECSLMIFYAITYFVIAYLITHTDVSGKVILLRVLPEHEKGVGLAIVALLLNLFVFIPGPIIFGALIDHTCLIWRQSSCDDSTGACLLYDIAAFRYATHGLTLAFVTCALGFATLTLYFIEKR